MPYPLSVNDNDETPYSAPTCQECRKNQAALGSVYCSRCMAEWQRQADERRIAKKAVRRARVVCAWCQTELQSGIEPTSHGICEDCAVAVAAGVSRPAGKDDGAA